MDPEFLTPLIGRWSKRAPLSQADVDAVRALNFRLKSFSRDAYLVKEGREAQDCTLLIKGFAYRQKLVRDGARQIISIHIPGEFVDLQNCLLSVADHNVQSLNNVEAALISKTELMTLATRRPEVGKAMWMDTLIDSSIFREWVVNVGRRDARTRIAHLLCELALRMDSAGLSRDGSYEFPLTQEQLADATGLTAVHTNRVLQALRKDGLIGLSSQSLTVPDWTALRDVGEFDERYLHHAA